MFTHTSFLSTFLLIMKCNLFALLLPIAVVLADQDTICATDPHGVRSCYPRLFNATHEFQPVKPGQDVPAGLHIQIDMGTGQRVAKLMPKEEAGLNPNNQQHKELAISTNVPDNEFQHYIDQVVSARINSSPLSSVVQALQAMEEEIHDRDYATQLFQQPNNAAVGTLLRMAEPVSVHGHHAIWPPQVRQLASVVLGTAVQNNPKLQQQALELGAINTMLGIVSAEPDQPTAAKHMFALASLIRGHAAALNIFVNGHGLQLLLDIMNHHQPHLLATNKAARKLVLRVAHFVEDIFDPSFFGPNARKALSGDVQRTIEIYAGHWCHSLQVWLHNSSNDKEDESMDVYSKTLSMLQTHYPHTCHTMPQQQHRNEL